MALRSGDLTLRKNIDEVYENKIYAVMNYRSKNQLSSSTSHIYSVFSISKTLFVCVVLIGMLHFFTEDINELIVRPIEDMMGQVM